MSGVDAKNLTASAREVTKKTFPIKSVLGITTGFTLEDGGGLGILTLMGHFFPGIFPMGAVAMSPIARQHILKVYPFLKEVPEMTKENWKAVLDAELKRLPPFLEFEGPLEVTPEDRQAAADDLFSKINSSREKRKD